MRFLKSKKVWWLPASAAALALLAVAAYAHFSRAGSGTGKLTSGQIGSIKISSDPAGPLYPVADLSGGSKVTVRIHNNGAGKQYVGQITGTVADNTGCSGPANFRVATIAAPGLLSPGEHDFTSAVALIESGTNQNVCAGKTFTINWSSAVG